MTRSRNSFDFLRLLAAALVLASHCCGLWDRRGDPFADFTGLTTMGSLGVAIFFAISGYWVTASWQNARSLKVFAANRVLRLFPALIICVLLSVFVLGPAMTTLSLTEYFSSKETWGYLNNAWLRLRWTLPGVFATNPYPNSINGSIWTLPIESVAYCAVAAIGLARLMHWRTTLAVTAALVLLLWLLARISWSPAVVVPGWVSIGVVENAKMLVPFFIGATVCLAGNRALSWWLCGVLVVAMWFVSRTAVAAPLTIAGAGYIALVVGMRPIPVLHRFGRYGDFSYGLYLYAWPVSQVLRSVMSDEVGMTGYLLACFVVTLALAVMSWFLVEKPFLALKRRSVLQRTSESAISA